LNSQELALIQGPPGTGKSFVGVQLVKILLKNRHLWAGKGAATAAPLVVICYTNRALGKKLTTSIPLIVKFKGIVSVWVPFRPPLEV
jgi:hypothetical protein